MKDSVMRFFQKVITFFKGIDNLYFKFILTVIAIALICIVFRLSDIANNLPDTFDGFVSGSVSID